MCHDTVILCGGFGTRLRGILPEGTPKILAPIDNTTFLNVLLNNLKLLGAITLAVGHNSMAIRKHAKTQSNLWIYTDKYLTGTAWCAWNFIQQSRHGTTLFLNGDTYCEMNYLGMLRSHARSRMPMTVSRAINGTCSGAFILEACALHRAKELFENRNLNDAFVEQFWLRIGPVNRFVHGEPYFDIGTPEGLETFKNFHQKRRIPSCGNITNSK